MDRHVKQVIVMRKDLNMRKGKMVAQGAHASMAAVLNIGKMVREYSDLDGSMIYTGYDIPLYLRQHEFNGKPDILLEPVQVWLEGTFTKVCVSVDSEEDLIGKHAAARLLGMPCALITDSGLTEFNGVPTKTCCAIGPWWSDEIDQITSELKLL
jgi:PTH2 family peptidyl-tRNA hydrolase